VGRAALDGPPCGPRRMPAWGPRPPGSLVAATEQTPRRPPAGDRRGGTRGLRRFDGAGGRRGGSTRGIPIRGSVRPPGSRAPGPKRGPAPRSSHLRAVKPRDAVVGGVPLRDHSDVRPRGVRGRSAAGAFRWWFHLDGGRAALGLNHIGMRKEAAGSRTISPARDTARHPFPRAIGPRGEGKGSAAALGWTMVASSQSRSDSGQAGAGARTPRHGPPPLGRSRDISTGVRGVAGRARQGGRAAFRKAKQRARAHGRMQGWTRPVPWTTRTVVRPAAGRGQGGRGDPDRGRLSMSPWGSRTRAASDRPGVPGGSSREDAGGLRGATSVPANWQPRIRAVEFAGGACKSRVDVGKGAARRAEESHTGFRAHEETLFFVEALLTGRALKRS